MRLAVEAGRLAYLAGRIPRRMYANASSPLEGVGGPLGEMLKRPITSDDPAPPARGARRGRPPVQRGADGARPRAAAARGRRRRRSARLRRQPGHAAQRALEDPRARVAAAGPRVAVAAGGLRVAPRSARSSSASRRSTPRWSITSIATWRARAPQQVAERTRGARRQARRPGDAFIAPDPSTCSRSPRTSTPRIAWPPAA